MNAAAYGGISAPVPNPLGTTPRDASQVKAKAFHDAQRMTKRRTNHTNQPALYPLTGTDDKQHAIPPSHLALMDTAGQDLVTPRVFATLNGEGIKELALAAGDAELARVLLKQRLRLFGVSLHDIQLTTVNNKRPYPFVQMGPAQLPLIDDDSIRVGDWIQFDMPTPNDLTNRMSSAPNSAVTPVIKKCKPQNYANFFKTLVRQALKPDNLNQLPKILDLKSSNIASAHVHGVSQEFQASLLNVVLGLYWAMMRGLLVVNPAGDLKPVEFFDDDGDALDPNIVASRMFYYMGLSSKRHDEEADDALNTPEALAADRKRFWKVFRLDMVNMLYTDGVNAAFDFGLPIDGDKVPLAPNPGRKSSDGSIEDNLIGEVLQAQIESVGKRASAMATAYREENSTVIGRVVNIEKDNQRMSVVVSPHH